MTVAERVTKWIKEWRGYAHCDGCVQRALKLPRPQQVQTVTSALANAPRFHRFSADCYECGEQRLVIEYR